MAAIECPSPTPSNEVTIGGVRTYVDRYYTQTGVRTKGVWQLSRKTMNFLVVATLSVRVDYSALWSRQNSLS